MFDYYWFLAIPGLILGIYAQIKLSAAYGKYVKVPVQSGLSGAEAAREILNHSGLNDVPVEEIGGHLTDHYDPAKKAVTRFDLVALGEVRGRPVDSNLFGERLGDPNMLGIVFELVANPRPGDYVSPKGLKNGGGRYDLPRYLGMVK